MAGFPGFNKIDSEKDFSQDVQDAMDAKFYGMTSAFANIYDGYLDNHEVKVGTDDAPLVIGHGNNTFVPQGSFEGVFDYDAAAGYERRYARRGRSRFSGVVQLLHPLPVRGRIRNLGKSFISSVLGKRDRDQASDSPAGKRRRDNNGAPVKAGATSRSIATTNTNEAICGGDFEHVDGKEADDVPARNLTNTNIHVYQRPCRKEYVGFWGFFQPAEDKSWTADPRTGKRIPVASV